MPCIGSKYKSLETLAYWVCRDMKADLGEGRLFLRPQRGVEFHVKCLFD